MKEKYIKEFSKKHGLVFKEMVDKDTVSFEGGHYFDIDDVVFDIDADINVGLIILYSKEVLRNASPLTFKAWLANSL